MFGVITKFKTTAGRRDALIAILTDWDPLPSLVAFVVASLTACASRTVSDSTGGPSPYAAEWIKQQIAQFETNSATDATRVEGRVVFNGTSLYLIRSPCCDFFNYLYTADGRVFCAPSGGFTGGGDGKCPPGIGPVSRRDAATEVIAR